MLHVPRDEKRSAFANDADECADYLLGVVLNHMTYVFPYTLNIHLSGKIVSIICREKNKTYRPPT